MNIVFNTSVLSHHCGSLEEVGGQVRGDEVSQAVAELGEVLVAEVGRRLRRQTFPTSR